MNNGYRGKVTRTEKEIAKLRRHRLRARRRGAYLCRGHLSVRQGAEIRSGPSQEIVRLRANCRLRVMLEYARKRRWYVYLLGAVNPLGLRIRHFSRAERKPEGPRPKWRPRQAEGSLTRDERETRFDVERFDWFVEMPAAPLPLSYFIFFEETSVGCIRKTAVRGIRKPLHVIGTFRESWLLARVLSLMTRNSDNRLA